MVQSLARYGTLSQYYSVDVRDGIECAVATPWHDEYKPRGLTVDVRDDGLVRDHLDDLFLGVW